MKRNYLQNGSRWQSGLGSRSLLARWPRVGALGLLIAVGLAVAQSSRQEGQMSPSEDIQTAAHLTPAVAGANLPDQVRLVSGPTEPAGEAPKNPLNAARAYDYLKQICAIGPRTSGSDGMREQLRLLRKHFAECGAQVSFQQFLAPNPLGGQRVPMLNLIAQFHPEKTERILICAHYDTRPFPDRDSDPVKATQGTFIGANDGASGVAVLMELAHLMRGLDIPYGVDFVCFDGEEFVFDERGRYFLGSEHFARQYVRQPPAYKYRWGVLLDMVGDKDMQIYQERHSVRWPDTLPLVSQIWGTAQRIGVKEFIARPKHEVLDDHLALRQIAKIPTCDIIDFDYPAWHTTQDVPEQCSGDSLAKVGWVVYEWLKGQPYAGDTQPAR